MDLARKLFGAIYLIGAAANLIMIMFQPDIYGSFANLALIPFYQNAWNSLVIPNLYVFVSLTIAFEIGLGALFLFGRRFLGLAYLISLGFNIGLIPFGLTFLYSNGVLVLVQVYLLSKVRNSDEYGLSGGKRVISGVKVRRN
ncbi:MAG: hypothetical protein ABEJ25_04390 [Candidatus Bipolaricaulia bacterium]